MSKQKSGTKKEPRETTFRELTYDRTTQTSSNLSKRKEVAYAKVAETYGAIAVVVTKREYPASMAETVKNTLVENYNENNDVLGLEKILIQTKYKQALEQDKALRKDKVKVFALLWSKISEESKEVIKRKYPLVEESLCPVVLLKAIELTHVFSTSGVSVADRAKSANKFYNTQHLPNQSIFDFKRKYSENLLSLKHAGTKIKDVDSAAQFLSKLNQNCTEFYCNLINNVSQDIIAFPENLEEAYRLAVENQPSVNLVIKK